MCPACMSTAAALIAGSGAIVSIATVVVTKFRPRQNEPGREQKPRKEDSDGNQ